MEIAKHRRDTDDSQKRLRFDLTVNVPVIVTLFLGFTSLVVTVVQGYYGHDARISKLELANGQLEKSEVVARQSEMAKDIATITQKVNALTDNSEKTENRLDRMEDKLDRVIEGRMKR